MVREGMTSAKTGGSAQRPSGASAPTSGSPLEDRMDRMEQRLDALLARWDAAAGQTAGDQGDSGDQGAAANQTDSSDPADPTTSDRFWALSALKSHLPAPGGVVYAGAVDLPIGHVEYQWGRPTDPLLRADWADRAERVASLGHPLRLSLLQKLLEGERTVAQLVDELDLASTGVAYHHLHQLQGAGWVTSPSRGTWAVPPTRVVPLLAIITALEEA